jgi:putative ABC transport system ATP-binding protein
MLLDLSIDNKIVSEPSGETRTLFASLRFRVNDTASSVALMGRSGSGKTTLLRILAGLDRNYSGSYAHRGKMLPNNEAAMAAFRMRHLGYVTQEFNLLRDRRVLNNVLIGARASSRAHASAMLTRVGLQGYEKKRVTQLSGGEAQRVAIARALIKQPSILLADEPTGALDIDTEDEILDLFDTIRQQGTTIIYATHSLRIAERCDQVFKIVDRQLMPASSQPQMPCAASTS